MPFFFNNDGTPLYEGDIVVTNNKTDGLINSIQTMQYEGKQPANTPLTGDIQAPSTVGLIIPPFTITHNSGNTTYSSTMEVWLSDTVNIADGLLLVSKTFTGTTQTFTLETITVLPPNKFLTVKQTRLIGLPSGSIGPLIVVRRGLNTKDIDPVLQ